MAEYKKHQLIVNAKIIKSFKFEIRNVIEYGDEFIVLLEIPFDNECEKNNILRIDASGNVVWTIDNSGYSNNSYPFERRLALFDRRLKVDIRTGKIVDMTISK